MAANGTTSRTVLVLGGGIGGVVAAHRLRKRLPARDRVVLVEREALHVFQPSLLWVTAGTRTPDAISRSFDRLERKGIEVLRGGVTAIEPARRRVRVNDRQLEADAVVIAFGAELAPANGWMAVDPHTLATGTPGVFAIGDATGIPIPSGKMLPKAGVFAERQAEVVADNLAAEWAGRAPTEAFDGTGSCFIETGNGRAGYGAGNFYTDPAPRMRLHAPAPWWHWGKVLFEKRWLRRWF